MKNKTIAVFYDGNSSVPQTIELFFDSNTSTFVFEIENNQLNWKIDNITFEKKTTTLELEHGQNLIQKISIDEIGFIDSVMAFRKKNGHIGWYQKLIDLKITSHICIAFFILAIIIMSYMYAIPWVAEKSVVLVPEEYDNKVGETFFNQNMLFSTIDTSKTESLNLFAKKLKLKNSKKLKFTVVKSELVNAFALPDGNIVIYTGILDSMKNYDELVALLGHEVSHVNNRHTMKMICRNLSGYLFVSAILGDANGIMAIIGENVNNLQSLSFSREFEHQADIDGFEILRLNGVNPKGISNLFKHLQNEKSIAIPEFLSSHPITQDRIIYIEKAIKEKPFQFKENPKLERLFRGIKQ